MLSAMKMRTMSKESKQGYVLLNNDNTFTSDRLYSTLSEAKVVKNQCSPFNDYISIYKAKLIIGEKK